MRKSQLTVIVGDLIGSRRIENRRQAAGRIRRALAAVGREYERQEGSQTFAAPPVLTRGIDEMSAVLHRPAAAYRLCRQINSAIMPLRFRFAIVTGPVDVGLSTADAARMDGMAFHIAAGGIQRARAADEMFHLSCSADERIDALLTALANTVHAMIGQLSPRQQLAVSLYERLGNQNGVARQMRITQQAVSDSLRSAQYHRLTTSNNVIDKYLEEL